MRAVLLGPPGAGKGTQALKIAKEFDIPHISTGDIFRQNLRDNTELGKLAKEYMDKGLLVPDEVTNRIVEDRLEKEDCKKGFLLDGYPRNIPQAEELDKFLEERGHSLTAVINIQVEREALIDRITGRRVCPVCGATYHIKTSPPKVDNVCDKCGSELIQRSDDKLESVVKRLEVYEKETKPLIDYYTKKGILVNIDGNKSIDEVFEDIKKALLGDRRNDIH
ncbi:MAG: Adenylate kinase [Caldanaerobacter subterraneus]|jgi:adenylate kinase|uniref:Adenylate kinase n=1 Tax=Caldanaerobacter subterraneus TaxID=911092 RepID=A0A101E5J8_9THEO|nr:MULTISPECIES: adenylate kinase [Caldanaerobacter]KUK08986.1 MAG: Adenylate kinase [Caldanaerobacter subterraneus]MDI3519721.1 adenylate kinase [Caldanaerobacter sp.]HBT49799.1 adenylate kinase [Caldanaerobacter subterraneus]